MDRKEAIEIIRKNFPDSSFTLLREALKTLIPELKESEDEKIRKALIEYYSFDKNGSSHALDNFTPKQVVAWLKKQGEKKVVDINEIKEKAHQIAWETSKHYDPNVCKQQWCEMAALDMALWLEKGITTK